MNEYLSPISCEEDLLIYENFLNEKNDLKIKKYKITYLNNRYEFYTGDITDLSGDFLVLNQNGKKVYINKTAIKYITEI